MPPFGPINRRDLIRALRNLGFSGPYRGTRHDYMERDGLRLRVPNEHRTDIGISLLSRILKQADISRDEWERA